MWKKYIKELIKCILVASVIVFALLILVWIFEKKEIHVPGSREMWIGLIGAILGGAFTLGGVFITLCRQEEQNKEDKRLEHMPILGFEIVEADRIEKNDGNVSDVDIIFDETLAYMEGELCTSAFLFVEEKLCKTIVISVLNNTCVFDFTIEGCLINGKEIKKGQAFNPGSRRLVSEEKFRLVFDYDDCPNENIFCIIRFSYKDVFGNSYYQDLPFEYAENEYEGTVEHQIEIRDIKAPILIDSETKSLEESAKEYIDYDTFCLE